MGRNKGEAAVLFSGGVDSTVAAVLAADRFDTVHLLTFDTPLLRFVHKPRHIVRELRWRLGEDRIVHKVLDVRPLWWRLQRDNLHRQFVRTRSWFPVCMGCKLAMHARTIAYCRENDIGHACGGENAGQEQYPEQMTASLVELRGMYADHGLTYLTPAYDLSLADEEQMLQRLGLPLGTYLKVIPGTKGSYLGNQPLCLFLPAYPVANALRPREDDVVTYIREHRDAVEADIAARLGED